MTSSFIGKVLDNYRILDRLGIGGMGVVFKAIHIKLEKIFALKLIAPGLAMNEKFIKRFQTEARSLAKFEDPNIVRIYDLRNDNDQWFIVMEYVDGINLLDKVKKEGAFQWQKAIPILKQMLSAIGHAHDAGIIHRDIKPNNIMLNQEGAVKITDFGLAKDQSSMTQTLTVTSGGTLYYMSPEHVKGTSFVEARSDIYSIGMTFYEMITGSVPFKDTHSDFDIRETIVRKDFPNPSSYNKEIPAELESIVMKSIAKDPDERYQTTKEMLLAVQKLEVDLGITDSNEVVLERQEKVAQHVESSNKVQQRSRDRPLIRLAKVVAGLMVIMTLAFLLYTNFFSTPSEEIENIYNSVLTITNQPSSAVVYLNGDSIGQAPIRNYQLSPGQYSLRLEKDNYSSIDTTIQVRGGQNIGLAFVMQSIKKIEDSVQSMERPVQKEDRPKSNLASISIQSNPRDAEIKINGQMKGRTPLQLKQIEPGSYKIQLQKEGYEDYSQQLDLEGGENQTISARLIIITGGLSVTKDPSSAIVLLDGREIASENTPQVELKNISVGKHNLEVVRQGYSSFKRDIEIKRDEIYIINAKLTQLEGSLSVQVRPWGSIYINNELQKTSSDIKYEIRLPINQYNIKVVHPTLGKWEKTVEVKADANTKLTINFNRKVDIKISAFDESGKPITCDIFLDDKETGKTTPDEIEVNLGVHRLVVKKDGFMAENGEKEILVEEGFSEMQMFILKKIY